MNVGIPNLAAVSFLAISLLFAGCASLFPNPALTRSAEVVTAARTPGQYPSPGAHCEASIDVSEMGGFLILSAGRLHGAKRHVVRDITGMAWAGSWDLIYTVSPIYGKPGLFRLNCSTMVEHKVVPPRTFSRAYPDGADYFELESVEVLGVVKARFYYTPDVDEADFASFRSLQNQRVVDFNLQ